MPDETKNQEADKNRLGVMKEQITFLIRQNVKMDKELRELRSHTSLSPKASDLDPYLPDLYWKWCSGIYTEFGNDIDPVARRRMAHEGAMKMTKRFREEILDPDYANTAYNKGHGEGWDEGYEHGCKSPEERGGI